VLRNIFVFKSEEVTEEWRKLHNEEPRGLYSSRNIIREVEWRRMWWKRMQGLGGKNPRKETTWKN